MSSRKKLEKLIEKAQLELDQLRQQCVSKEAFIAGLHEARKLIPEHNARPIDAAATLRKGSVTFKVYTLLKQKGKPLHIVEIMKGIGMEPTKENKASITGTLGSYFRNNKIFSRPEANTFGLLSFSSDSNDESFDLTDDEVVEDEESDEDFLDL